MNPEDQSNGFANAEFTKQPVFWQLVILMSLLIVIFSSAIVRELSEFAAIARPPAGIDTEQNAAAVIVSQPELQHEVDLSNVHVAAKSAYVLDARTGKTLYEKNADEVLPLASVTKLMTALVANEILSEEASVTIDLEAILQDGDSGLTGGEEFSLETLNDLVLMTSSNDGAYALADTAGESLLPGEGNEAFVVAMNIRAEQLGLHSLRFYNPTGLDLSETDPGAVGSAKDVTKLMNFIVAHQPKVLKATTQSQERFYNEAGAYHTARNTNAAVNEIPGLMGSKTGFTDLAGGNLVIVYNQGLNRPIIITVLGSGRTERFDDVLRLVEAINEPFTE